MGLMYQDLDKPQAAINCFFESLERNILMYQSDGLKVDNSLSVFVSKIVGR